MPAIDECQPQIITALTKLGWQVTHQPFVIRISKTEGVFADLRLQHVSDHRTIIIVEVKCFTETRSILDEFYHIVGQYILYRQALLLKQIDTPLFLAMPIQAFEQLSQKQTIVSVLEQNQIKIIVVNLGREEVVAWIP
jgi:hypothetical protein